METEKISSEVVKAVIQDFASPLSSDVQEISPDLEKTFSANPDESLPPREDATNLVDFEENDPENPLNWATWRKWVIVVLVASGLLLANFGTIVIVPAVPEILREFNVENQLYATLLVSIWELGEACGQTFVGPLSELYGRMPVYHTGNVLSIICSVASALSTNISMLIVFRFLNGLCVTSLTLGPSIVGDLFRKETRGSSMAITIALPMISPYFAPIVGSYTAQAKGWRWTIWIYVILIGTITCLSVLFFRETYQVKILERKAERLRKTTNNVLLRSKHQDAINKTTIIKSLTRPLMLLFCSPVVLIISFFTALTYGISYLILTTLARIMESIYGFGQGPVGLPFLGPAIGNLFGIILYGLTSDSYVKYKKEKEGVLKPEHRLPLTLLAGLVLPMALFLYGWTLNPRIHWIVPIIGTAIVNFCMLLAVLSTENYLVDVYEIRTTNSASAIAAGVILRAIFGAIFPLIGPPLYNRLKLGWGNSVLAFISMAFVPSLWILWKYGENIRNSRRVGRLHTLSVG